MNDPHREKQPRYDWMAEFIAVLLTVSVSGWFVFEWSYWTQSQLGK